MPAAAVIPAPIAYIKVVAVKTLVVEFRARRLGWAIRFVSSRWSTLSGVGHMFLTGRVDISAPDVYFEKIRVFKAGVSL